MRRLLRWLVRLTAIAAVTAMLALGGGLLWLRTPGGQRTAREALASVLGQATGARVFFGGIGGSLVRTVTVDDFRLEFPGGPRLHVEHARVRWVPVALLLGTLRVNAVEASGVDLRAAHTPAGWGFPDLGDEEDTGERRTVTVDVRAVRVHDARIALALRDGESRRLIALRDVAIDAAVRLDPTALRVHVERLTAVPRGVAVSPVELAATFSVAEPLAVDVERVDVATRRSRVTAFGTIAPERRTVMRVDLAPLDAGELRALLPAVALGSDVTATLRVTGPWNALGVNSTADLGPGGRVAVRGAVDLADPAIAYRARARLDDVDPAAILAELPAGRLRGTAGVSGRGVDRTPTATYRVQLADSEVAARTVRQLRLLGRTAGGHHDVRARAVLAAAVAAVRARAVLEPTLAWRARGRVGVDDLSSLVADLPGRVRADLTASGRGTAAHERSLDARIELDGSIVRGVRVDDGALALRLRGEHLALAPVRLRGPRLSLDATASADLAARRLDGGLDLRFDLGAVDPPPLAGLAGQLELRGTVGGTPDAVDARGDGRLVSLSAGDVRAAATHITIEAKGLGGADPVATATMAGSGVRVGEGAPWTGTSEVSWSRRTGTDVARVAVRGDGADGAVLDAAAELWREPHFRWGRLDRFAFAPPRGERWTLVAPARVTLTSADGLDVPWLALGSGGQRITLSGRAGATGPAEATLELADVALAPLCTLYAERRCGGRADGTVRLAGTAAAPVVHAELHATGIMVEDARYGDLTARGEYAARALTAEAALAYPKAGTLDLDARVPLDLAWDGPRADLRAAPVALRLRADDLDLRFVPALAPTVLRELDGRLTADLRLDGPWNGLSPSGGARLSARRLLLAATGVPYEDVEARLAATTGGVALERLAMRAGDGRMQGEGRVGFRDGRPDALDLHATFEDFQAVRLAAYEAAVDGTVDVGGTLAAPRVQGTLDVERAVVRPAMLPTSGPDLRPDPTIQVVGLPEGPASSAPGEGTPLADAIALDLTVRVERDAWIRRPDAQIELAGNLRVTKEPGGQPRITGTVRLVRGWYAFQGRRFDLDEGAIVFSGQSPPDPSFEVRASHRSGEYRVLIVIGGTATKPTLDLSSDPPLEQADVLSVLLFGKPASQLGQGESLDLQRQAVSLASGYLMPELQTSVMESLGLDTFELGSEGLRAGRYVAQDVFLSVASEFGQEPSQSVSVEYALTRRLSLKATTATNGESAIDLQWHRRY